MCKRKLTEEVDRGKLTEADSYPPKSTKLIARDRFGNTET